MPNTKSAVKRVRSSAVKRLRNRMKRSELKTALRRFREAVEAKSPQLQEIFKYTVKKVDQAAAKNIIHKNAASRKKSQLQKALNSALADK